MLFSVNLSKHILNQTHCSYSLSRYVCLEKDNCWGSHLIDPSVQYPSGTLPPQILSHVQSWQKTCTQTQSRATTAALHFITEKSTLQRNPALQLGGSACVIRCPEQMKYGATCWSRLLYLCKGYFHHWFVIWNLFLDSFASFQINQHLMVCVKVVSTPVKVN